MTAEDHVLLGDLALDTKGVISHASAAQLWDIRLLNEPARPAVTIARNNSRLIRPGIDLHRASLAAGERVVLSGVPVTSVTRTVSDLAKQLPFEAAVVSADGALDRKLVSLAELRDAARSARGAGSGNVRRAVCAADGRSQSVPETLLRLRLRHRPEVGRVVPQFAIWLGGHRYDLGFPELRVVAEFQSWEFHGTRKVWRRDARWGNEARAARWWYVQITHEDLIQGMDHVVGLILGI